MRVEFEFYANLRDAVGEKTVTRELEAGATVEDALRTIVDDYEGLESLVFRENDEVRPNVTISVNGDPILEDDPGEVALSEGDTVVLAPGVSGGDTAANAEARP